MLSCYSFTSCLLNSHKLYRLACILNLNWSLKSFAEISNLLEKLFVSFLANQDKKTSPSAQNTAGKGAFGKKQKWMVRVLFQLHLQQGGEETWEDSGTQTMKICSGNT